MGFHSLLQGIFLTQELNLGHLHCKQIPYILAPWEAPISFTPYNTLLLLLLLLLLSRVSRVRLCATPQTAAQQAPLSLGFSRQEYWGCHFLLQCMTVKSESEVTQSCPTLSDPKDCSLPGSSVHGILQARVLEWDAIVFSIIPIIQTLIFSLPIFFFTLSEDNAKRGEKIHAVSQLASIVQICLCSKFCSPYTLLHSLSKFFQDCNNNTDSSRIFEKVCFHYVNIICFHFLQGKEENGLGIKNKIIEFSKEFLF